MSKVLYIKANVKKEGESRTFKVADSFIEEYKKKNPEDEIVVLDLYKENVDFLRSEDLEKISGLKDENNKEGILKYAYQFRDADKYIFAAPMWNLSFPAILKAYIDYISVTGITFTYTDKGPIGLLKDKKALHVVSRGGAYLNTPYEMGDRYLRTLLNFLGVEDIKTIAIENLDVIGIDVEAILNEKIEEAKQLAKNF